MLPAFAFAVGLAGCFFPSYTFDEDGAGGGTTSSTTTSTSTSVGGGTTTSTGGGATTSTTTGTGGAGGGVGGGATTTSSTGGMGTGGTGGGVVSLEDCFNGTDDDMNGDIDCADAGCAGKVSCVSPAPSGWTGFFSVYEGPAGSFGGCPATYPNQVFAGNSGLVAPQATCSTCMCGGPTGRTCDLASTIETGDATCGQTTFCSAAFPVSMGWMGMCEGTSLLAGGQTTCGASASATCDTPTGVACNQSVSMAQASISGGSCTPTTVVPTKTAPTWTNLGIACGDPSTTPLGCNGNFSCLAKPSAGFETGVCVMKAGVNACPAGAFTKQHVFYGGFTDTRSCSACGCDPPTGGTCSANVLVYSDSFQNQCNSQIASFVVTNSMGGCANLTGNPPVSNHKATITPPSGGSCNATGGAPIGAALPDASTATTFCCL